MSQLSNDTLERLPVASFDHYFLNDDTDNYPGIFYMRMQFTGIFDHKVFENAVRSALVRAPILRSVLEGNPEDRRTALCFKPVALEPFVQWLKGEAVAVYPHQNTSRFDLYREYGFRLFMRERQNKTELLLQLHHACVDATGARMFVEDILAYYEQQVEGKPESSAKLRPLIPETLLHRDNFHQSAEDLKKRRWMDIATVIKILLFQPKAIAGAAQTAKEGPAFTSPATAWHEFSADEFEAIRKAAKQRQGTINDYFLWCLFLAIDDWNRKTNPNGKSSPVRLGMAINLRQKPDDDVIPPANVLSMYFLNRGPVQLSNPDLLFKSVVTETQHVKSNKMGLTFILLSRFLGRFRGGIQQLLKPRPLFSKCMVTANLSNLGFTFADSPLMNDEGKVKAADIVLERVELMPPFRAHTHGAFGVASYDGKIVATFNFDPRTLTQEQGDAIMSGLVERIFKHCGKEVVTENIRAEVTA